MYDCWGKCAVAGGTASGSRRQGQSLRGDGTIFTTDTAEAKLGRWSTRKYIEGGQEVVSPCPERNSAFMQGREDYIHHLDLILTRTQDPE